MCTPQYYNHLIIINNSTLLAGSVIGTMRLYNISNMKDLYCYKQKSFIKQIIYFNKYKLIAMLNDSDDIVYLFNLKLKLVRMLINPIRGCVFNHIEKLNDTHMITCSDICTPILKWDISTGEII